MPKHLTIQAPPWSTLDQYIDFIGTKRRWGDKRKQSEYDSAKGLLYDKQYDRQHIAERNRANKYDTETVHISRVGLAILTSQKGDAWNITIYGLEKIKYFKYGGANNDDRR